MGICQLIHVIAIACNMLACAILFAPWALSRETISGLLGRWTATETGWKGRFGVVCARVVNLVHFWEPDHCGDAYRTERRSREVLYR